MRGNIPPCFSAFKMLGGKDKKKKSSAKSFDEAQDKKNVGVVGSSVEHKQLIK
jgi:hypothetical protein